MFGRRLLTMLAGSLLLGRGAIAAADEAPLDEPLLTRQSAFSIPFEFEAAAGDNAEARLFVSADRGKTWLQAAAVVAPAESFKYQAAADGEYWFVVRTDDSDAAQVSAEQPSPELRVVVDSTPPRFDISAVPAADGTLVIRWKADDARLSPEPLKLTYRFAGSNEPAQPVDTPRAKRQFDPSAASGELQWRPVVSDRPFTLQAELRDAAGNSVVREFRPTSGTDGVAGSAPPQLASASAPSAAVAPPMALRDPSKPLLVNSLSFELDYEVDGLSGDVTKVEVWGTRDDGQTWVLLGLDDDRRTPCSVNVDAEGRYGFAVVVEGAGGAKDAPPTAGDAPEIRVGVDLTAPQVRLTTAEPDENNQPCKLKINWEARDEHLGPQAVTLSYSASPQGPWRPLAGGIASTGSHVCDFDPNGPDLAYLKIDVRDEAGNVGTFATTVPIPIERRQVQISFAGATKTEGSTRPKWFHVLR